MSNVNLEISPSNVLSDGKVSFKNGNPVLTFIIGESEKLLIGRSVRLAGKFRVKVNEAEDETDMVTANDLIQSSARLGVYGAIDQVVIKSQQTHQVIEHIRHYNRFMSSYLPATTSLCDGTSHLSESALIMPNWNLFKQSVLDNTAQATTGNSFCVPLPCGLFNGTQDIPLSSSWGLKGLIVEIHLCPDNNFLFSQTAESANLVNASYELSDVKLVCEATVPSAEMLKSYPTSGGTFEYNSISSYFTSVNSTNAIINFNLGLKKVLGVFMNFISSAKINNLAYDGMGTQALQNAVVGGEVQPAPIQQLVFQRGGDKFPLEYNIDYLGTDGSNYREVDAQVYRNYVNAIRQWAGNDRVTSSQVNTHERTNEAAPLGRDGLGEGGVAGGELKTGPLNGGNGFGVGMSYDVISDEGVDFSTQAFGVQMTTGLTTNNPQAVFLYVHSKNTLVYSPNGLQVLV